MSAVSIGEINQYRAEKRTIKESIAFFSDSYVPSWGEGEGEREGVGERGGGKGLGILFSPFRHRDPSQERPGYFQASGYFGDFFYVICLKEIAHTSMSVSVCATKRSRCRKPNALCLPLPQSENFFYLVTGTERKNVTQ